MEREMKSSTLFIREMAPKEMKEVTWDGAYVQEERRITGGRRTESNTIRCSELINRKYSVCNRVKNGVRLQQEEECDTQKP